MSGSVLVYKRSTVHLYFVGPDLGPTRVLMPNLQLDWGMPLQPDRAYRSYLLNINAVQESIAVA